MGLQRTSGDRGTRRYEAGVAKVGNGRLWPRDTNHPHHPWALSGCHHPAVVWPIPFPIVEGPLPVFVCLRFLGSGLRFCPIRSLIGVNLTPSSNSSPPDIMRPIA